MSSNEKDESLQRGAEKDQPLKETDDSSGRDSVKPPVHPPDASRPSERPDLDWSEHED